MSVVVIAVLLLVCVFVAVSIALSRTTHEVESAHDDEYLELEGNWIRYRVTGGGPPVLLVHGWLSSSRVWEPLTECLAQRFSVYSLDLAGFGDSDKPVSGYGVRYGSRLLYAFCAHFGLTRTAVVGHDIGGAMALKLAADHPDVVGRLILVATPANEDQIDLPTFLWLATLPVVGPIFYALGRFLRPLRILWLRPFVLDREALTEQLVEDAGKSTPAAISKTIEVTRREIARGRLARQVGIIRAPALAIAGEGDQIVDPRATNDWARTFSAEIVLMEGCGHLPMLERTGEFNVRVLAFLTGDPRYLDSVHELPEEPVEDVAVAETPKETSPPTFSEPADTDSDTPPPGSGEKHDRYPPYEPGTEHREGSYEVTDPPSDATVDQSLERNLDRNLEPTTGDGVEGPPQGRAGNEGEAGAIIPEIPKDLFDWPESSEGSWDRNRSGEVGRQAREERDEDADPKALENDPPT